MVGTASVDTPHTPETPTDITETPRETPTDTPAVDTAQLPRQRQLEDGQPPVTPPPPPPTPAIFPPPAGPLTITVTRKRKRKEILIISVIETADGLGEGTLTLKKRQKFDKIEIFVNI